MGVEHATDPCVAMTITCKTIGWQTSQRFIRPIVSITSVTSFSYFLVAQPVSV